MDRNVMESDAKFIDRLVDKIYELEESYKISEGFNQELNEDVRKMHIFYKRKTAELEADVKRYKEGICNQVDEIAELKEKNAMLKTNLQLSRLLEKGTPEAVAKVQAQAIRDMVDDGTYIQWHVGDFLSKGSILNYADKLEQGDD